LPKTLEPITCPNPKCHKKIEELIIVTNASETLKEQYYSRAKRRKKDGRKRSFEVSSSFWIFSDAGVSSW
jgi:hypothetical protein